MTSAWGVEDGSVAKGFKFPKPKGRPPGPHLLTPVPGGGPLGHIRAKHDQSTEFFSMANRVHRVKGAVAAQGRADASAKAAKGAGRRQKNGAFFDGAAAGQYVGTRQKMAALHVPDQAEAHLKAWTRGEK